MSDSTNGMLEQLAVLSRARVRVMLTAGNIPDDWDVRFVTHWLAEKDYEAQCLNSANREDERKLLLDGVARANKKLTWALLIAVVALVVTVFVAFLAYLDMIEASS